MRLDMRISRFVVPLAVLASWACAATVPPPRFSTLDPADPQAPESAASPRPSLLEPRAAASPSPSPTPSPERKP
jgi:hypothetical protein